MQAHGHQQGYTVTPRSQNLKRTTLVRYHWWYNLVNRILLWIMVSEKKKPTYFHLTFLLYVKFARCSYKNRTNTSTTWSLWNNHINHHFSHHGMYCYNFSFQDDFPFTTAVIQPLLNSTLEWCQLAIFNISNLFNTVLSIWNYAFYNHKSLQCNSTE